LADGSEAFDGIKAALSRGDIASAAKLLWELIKLEFEQGKAAINSVWLEAKRFFLDTWTEGIYNVSSIIIKACALIETAWSTTIYAMQMAWSALAKTMINVMTPVMAALAGQEAVIVARLQGIGKEDADKMGEYAAAGVTAAMGAIGGLVDKGIVDATTKHANHIKEIDDRKKDTLAENKEASDAEIAAHRKSQDDSLAAAKKRVAEARKGFDDAVKAAKTGASGDAKKAGMSPGMGELTERGNSVTGTFSGFGVYGLGAGAKTLEQIASNTAASNKILNDMFDLWDNGVPTAFWKP
jgi:hypothetical protein